MTAGRPIAAITGASGYLGRVIRSAFDAEGWLRTRDAGSFEDGRLTVFGRLDDVIVTGGETNYIMATLAIFLDLYNIFISLLNLLMAFTGQRD